MITKPSACRSRRAFTLVELLVVIAVVALLIGILLPVLGSARDAAKTATCLSNLRQLGQATMGYVTDNRQTYPQPFTEGQLATAEQRKTALWFNAVDRYLGQQVASSTSAATDRNYDVYKQDPVWLGLPEAVKSGASFVTLSPEVVRTIKMNDFFGESRGSTQVPPGFSPVNFVKVLDVVEPARTLLYGDGRAHDTPSTTTGNVDTGGSGSFSMNPQTVGLRHGDGANLAYADGSAGYQENPIQVSGAGYRGWFDPYGSGVTADEYPDVIFRFQPERYGATRIRARGGNS